MRTNTLLDDKALMDAYLNRGPRPVSAFSFVSMFAWSDFFEFELKVMEGCLCVFAQGEAGCFLYLPPLGNESTPAVIASAFSHMARGASPRAVNRIENIPGNMLSAFNGGSYNQYLKPAEYVYRKDDLTGLSGNAYKSQRHDCNCFMARHPGHTFGPYEDTDFDLCMDLYERWAAHRSQAHGGDIYRSMLEENRLVHARLLKFWQPLGLTVRVLKAGGRLAGYTFGFGLDEQTFCVYAEIADLTIPGAAAFMFRALCADEALGAFDRINTMDDFAMPNVARAKQAYHPWALTESFTVSMKA